MVANVLDVSVIAPKLDNGPVADISLASRSKPYDDLGTVSVDVTHHTNLMSSLLRVILVNAEPVNPQDNNIRSVSQPAQDCMKIWHHSDLPEILAVNVLLDGFCTSLPGIRKRSVFSFCIFQRALGQSAGYLPTSRQQAQKADGSFVLD